MEGTWRVGDSTAPLGAADHGRRVCGAGQAAWPSTSLPSPSAQRLAHHKRSSSKQGHIFKYINDNNKKRTSLKNIPVIPRVHRPHASRDRQGLRQPLIPEFSTREEKMLSCSGEVSARPLPWKKTSTRVPAGPAPSRKTSFVFHNGQELKG